MRNVFVFSLLSLLISKAFAGELPKFAGFAQLGFGETKCEELKSVDAYGKPSCSKRGLTHKVYEKPNDKSTSLGQIKYIITPGGSDKFVPPVLKWIKPDGKEVEFEADYSKYGEHTYIGCQNEWYQLPRNPFANRVWTKLPNLGPCEPPVAIGGKLKANVNGVEVGTNKKVLLPVGKDIKFLYRDGKIFAIEHFTNDDISNDDPSLKEALEAKQKAVKMTQSQKDEFIEDTKRNMIIELDRKEKYKGHFEVQLKDILDKDFHLLLEQAYVDDPKIETIYLETQPKK